MRDGGEREGGCRRRAHGREHIERVHGPQLPITNEKPQSDDDDGDKKRVCALNLVDAPKLEGRRIQGELGDPHRHGAEHTEHREVAVEDRESTTKEHLALHRFGQLEAIRSDDRSQRPVERRCLVTLHRRGSVEASSS